MPPSSGNGRGSRTRPIPWFAILGVLLLAAIPAAALESSLDATRVTGERSVASLYPELDGAGVVIAILDTGVDNEHPAFEGAFLAGVDASTNLIQNKDPVTGAPHDPDDRDGHGTHVAAIALGRGEPRGVAPAARLVDVKIASDLAGISVGGVARGLEWVLDYNAGNTAYGSPGANRIDIVSVSYATFTPGDPNDGSDRTLALVDALVESGVVVVVAAGNCGAGQPSSSCSTSGPNTIGSPGVAKGAITVGAVDDKGTADREDDSIAPYSSYGPNGAEPKPNVVAPGSMVASARCGGCPGNTGAATGTVEKSGTSMAAPHVAGVAALLLDAKPSLTPDDVKRLLMTSAAKRWSGADWSTFVPEAWADAYTDWSPARGAGYVDALAAVRKLKGDNVPPVAHVSVTPGETGTTATPFTFSGKNSMDPDGPIPAGSFVWTSEPTARYHRGIEWRNVTFPAGIHTVSLVVMDADGARSAPANVTVTVTKAPPPPVMNGTERPNEAPSARAESSSRAPREGESVNLDGSLSVDPDGDALSYAWDFESDGAVDAEGAFVTHTFTTAGRHLVTLTVSDGRGGQSIDTLTLDVRERASQGVPPTNGTGSPHEKEGGVDSTPPVLVLLEPGDGTEVAAGTVFVRWHVRDDSGVARVTVLVDEAVEAVSHTNETRISLAAGSRTLRVVAEDTAGNTAEVVATVFVIGDTDDGLEGTGATVRGGEDPRGIPGAGTLAAVTVIGIGAWVRRLCGRRL